MSYIGAQPTTVSFPTDTFNGTGSQTAFTMQLAPASTNSVIVAVSGVLQDPSTYSVSGTTLTFSAAPPAGTGNISVRFLGVPGIPNTPTAGSITNSSFANTLTAIPMQSGTLGAGDSSSMKNRIINGAMVIDQRNAGASVTFNDNVFPVDRFRSNVSQSSKMTAQQNAGSVTPPSGFNNYLGMTSSSAYSITSTDYFDLCQFIEGFNVADLDWGTANAKTVTLSFWVRSSLTGTFGGSVANSATNRCYVFSYTISSANTWEYKTVTIPGDTTGTWLKTNNQGILLFFGMGDGASVSGTAGSWGSTFFRNVTGNTSVVGTNGATFYITGVQLEVGSTATSFDYRPYGTELALCQRYFYNSYTWIISNSTGVNGNQYANGFHPVQMRANPTYALQSGSWTTSTPVLDGSTPLSYRLASASSFFSGSTALISFSAEL